MAVHKDVRTPSRALFDRRTSRGKANRGDDMAPEQELKSKKRKATSEDKFTMPPRVSPRFVELNGIRSDQSNEELSFGYQVPLQARKISYNFKTARDAPLSSGLCSAFNDFGAACLDHQRQFELLSEVGAGRRREDAITHARSDGMVAEEGRLLGSRALAAISTRGHTNKTVICREGNPLSSKEIAECHYQIKLPLYRKYVELCDLQILLSLIKILQVLAIPEASIIADFAGMPAPMFQVPIMNPVFSCTNTRCGEFGFGRSAGGAFENLISYSSFIVSEVSTGLPRSVLNCFIDDNLEKAPLTLTKDVFLCWKDEDTLEIDMGCLCWFAYNNYQKWWLCGGGGASSFRQIVQHGSGLIQTDLALAARPAARAEANRGRVRPALAWIGWSGYKVAALVVGGALILGGFARLRSGRAGKAARAAWMRVVGGAGMMAAISGPALLGGTILESPLRRWLPHLSLVDHSCGGPSARSGYSLLIRSVLGSRWGGLSAPLYLALAIDPGTSTMSTETLNLIRFGSLHLFITNVLDRTPVYMKRENADSWNSGLERSKSEIHILHNSKYPETF
ncbi:unnamed protein product [Triticum turgidum subsp. durum]|uniref:Uncharacterized protein n=1 Tax=Triticum turgidum subsp. durum TaxID=4567 RepID=A0A9R0Q626_TRITD|nr:unnamed protein product [Triticum turgidum subsp. durum]